MNQRSAFWYSSKVPPDSVFGSGTSSDNCAKWQALPPNGALSVGPSFTASLLAAVLLAGDRGKQQSSRACSNLKRGEGEMGLEHYYR
jgi:hypothetical protein